MEHKAKNVLSLDSEGAMDFFLKSEQYHGLELPESIVDRLDEENKENMQKLIDSGYASIKCS